jgi:hypothetical protein
MIVLNNLKRILLFSSALFFIWFVWPTQYRYFEVDQAFGHEEVHGCREQRITGRVQCLVPGTDGQVDWVGHE